MEELTQAQLSTDGRLDKLIDVVSNLAQEMGGLSRSVSYSLENEAYRQLPAYLEAEHDIVLDERMVRTDVDGEEINIFALGHRGDVPIVLVGESKLQLDRRRGGRDAAEQVMEPTGAQGRSGEGCVSGPGDRPTVDHPLRSAGGTRSGGSARRYLGPKLRMVTARSHPQWAADQFHPRIATDRQ